MAEETKITPPPPEVINGVIKLRSKTTQANIQSIVKEIPDITQTPSSNQFGGFVDFYDDTTHLLGRVYAVKTSNDFQGVFLQAWNSTRTADGGIGVLVNEGTGQVTTVVPQPPANSNTREIATTSWVRNVLTAQAFPTFGNTGIAVTWANNSTYTTPTNGWLSINLSGSYMNGFRIFGGPDSTYPVLFAVGDDINANTKWVSGFIPIAGAVTLYRSDQLPHAFETIQIRFYPAN